MANAEGNVRLFLGEAVLVDDRVRAFVAQAANKAQITPELVIIRPPADSLAQARDALEQIGLFSSARAVWIRGLAGEPEDQVDDLIDLLDNPPGDDSIVVASAAGIDQRTRLYKWFKRCEAVEDCRMEKDRSGRLAESAVAAFAASRMRAAGVANPDRAAVAAIVDRVGGDVGELAQEIDKVCLAAGSSEVTAALVREHMRDMGETWVFALTDALSVRDLGRAEQVLEQLLRQGEPALKLIAVLATHLSQLFDARLELDRLGRGALKPGATSLDKQTYAALSDQFRARNKSPWRAFHLLRGASAYRRAEIAGLHGRLVAIDLGLKSGGAGRAAELLSSFLAQACAGRA